MRSWPSWLAIIFGTLLAIAGFWLTNGQRNTVYLSGLLLPGAILLAAGLHSLQATYDAWCGDCYGGGCGCDHCRGCSGGECCGNCGCGNMRGSGGHEGHEGHDHGPGEHSH
jgi:hypothetical protein